MTAFGAARRAPTGESARKAFDALVDRYQTRLLRFITCTIGDRERAEELVQEVFIRVFRHLHRFDGTKKVSTWIYTIASNLAKTELLQRPLEFVDATARPADRVPRTPLADTVAQCVRQLPESLRDVFVLRELEALSYEEIAEITGCDVGMVRSLLSRARTSFAQVVQPLVNDMPSIPRTQRASSFDSQQTRAPAQ